MSVLPAVKIVSPGCWKGLVFNISGIGEIDLWRSFPTPLSPPPYPRFKIAYNVSGIPFFSLLKLNEQTGAILGEPITTRFGTTGTRAFYIDDCGGKIVFYRHNPNLDLIGEFTDSDFVNMNAVSGLVSSVIGLSLQKECSCCSTCNTCGNFCNGCQPLDFCSICFQRM